MKRKKSLFLRKILTCTKHVHGSTNTKIKLFRKMEKTLFISTLKEKAGVDNVSDRSFDEVAGMFLPQFEDDSKVTDDSWTLPVQVIKTMSGQLRHDTSEGINAFKTKFEDEQKKTLLKEKDDAIAAFKAQWEKDHPTKKDEPAGEKTIEEKIAEGIAKAMEGVVGENGSIGKLTKQFTDYIAKTEQEKKDAAVAKIREALKSYLMDERQADGEPVVNLAIKETEVTVDADIDKLKIEVEKKYESLYKEFYGEGRRPYSGGGGGSDDNSTKEFEDFIKNKQDAAKKEAEEAEKLRKTMM